MADGAGADRIARPPDGDDYLRLPAAFGRRFTVFVDTEEEFDWSRPLSRDQRSTEAMGAIATAHRHLSAHGIKPVYLIDHPVATSPRAVATLHAFQEAGECTIGTHLHPWVNPPFEEAVTGPNSFAGNLPPALEQAKLAQLTDTIAAAFGRRPTVYRAGRYGVGPATAGILRDLGYRIDVSVRALFDYRSERGPDFSGIAPRPYWIAADLLEVPLTAAYTGAVRRLGPKLYPAAGAIPRMRGLLSRMRLLDRVALTPEDMPLGAVLEAIERLLGDGLQLFSISFHSPTVAPGHTPYVRDAADLARFYAWWDGVLAAFDRHGVSPASIEEVEAACQAAAAPVSAPRAIRRQGL